MTTPPPATPPSVLTTTSSVRRSPRFNDVAATTAGVASKNNKSSTSKKSLAKPTRILHSSDSSSDDESPCPPPKKKLSVPPPKKKAKAVSSEKNGSGKPPNYSEDEDFLISCAYTNVSVDPIKGVGQKADTFWTRVHEKFLILSQKHFSDNALDMPMRTKESIEQRWKKRISKCVQLWNKFYRQLKSVNRSGWNEDKYIEEAGNLYLSEVGEPFKYAKCVPVLHKLPKFDPMVRNGGVTSVTSADSAPCEALDTDADGDQCSVAVRTPGSQNKKNVNNSVPAQGSELPRPIGMKKAKKLEKVRSSAAKASIDSGRTSSDNVANEFLADMSAVTKDLVAAFKANTSMKREDLTARKHDKWMKMADVYIACGQQEKALALLAKIQDEESFFTSTSVDNPEIPSAIEVGDTTTTGKEDKNSAPDDDDEDRVLLGAEQEV